MSFGSAATWRLPTIVERRSRLTGTSRISSVQKTSLEVINKTVMVRDIVQEVVNAVAAAATYYEVQVQQVQDSEETVLSTHGASGGGNAGREIRGLHPSILARKSPTSDPVRAKLNSSKDRALRPAPSSMSDNIRRFKDFWFLLLFFCHPRPTNFGFGNLRGSAPLGDTSATSTDGHGNRNRGWLSYDLSPSLVLDTYVWCDLGAKVPLMLNLRGVRDSRPVSLLAESPHLPGAICIEPWQG